MNAQLSSSLKIKNLYMRPNLALMGLKPILIKLLEQSVNGKIMLACFKLVWNILIDV